MFMISFLNITKGILNRLDYYISRFFFGKDINIKKSIDLLDGT